MNKKIFFLLIMIISSFTTLGVIVENDVDTQVYYSLDNDNLSIGNPLDRTPNVNDGINNGATTGVTGILGEAFSFVRSQTDSLNTTYIPSADNFSVSMWVKFDNQANVQGVVNTMPVTSNRDGFLLRRNTDGTWQFETYVANANQCNSAQTASMTNSVWYHIVVSYYQNGTAMIYQNGNGVYSNDGCSFSTHDGAVDFGQLYGTNSNNLDGDLDELSVWNRTLTESEAQFLYMSGAPNSTAQYPFSSGDSDVNDSVESTAVVKQVGTININSPTFTTVISSNFDVAVNNTDLYGSYSFNVQSANANTLICELLIDGTVFGNITRTQTPGQLGSVYLQSEIFTLENGTHSQELRCRRSLGGGPVTISNSVGIGHLLIDEDLNVVPHNETVSTTSVTSGASFTLMDEINFTISNRTIGGADNLTANMVLEWMSTYTNNGASTELLDTYISINGSNCSFYPRTVISGGTGSVSGDCLIKNADINETYNIKIYGNGTNAEYYFDLKVKEFLLSPEEIEGGTGFPVPTYFWGDTNTLLFNFTGGNLNHGLTNVFQKNAFSVTANESTTVVFFVELVDGTNFTTVNFTRDVDTTVGVVIGHDVLENVTQDTYVSKLWANCGSSTANCSVVGGDGIGYITDVTTTLINSFTIKAFDNFDDSVISNFTVVNGGNQNTTNGEVEYVYGNVTFVNFTVTSEFNGGYFNVTVLNHNVSNDINISMNQTWIMWDCIEVISGDDINCSKSQPFYPVEGEVFNYNVIGNPHTENLASTTLNNPRNYYDETVTFNVTALENTTFNVSFGYVNLSFTAVSDVGNLTICSYNLSSFDYDWNSTETGSPNTTGVRIINGDYEVFVDCPGFALTSLNFTVNHTSTTLFNAQYNFTMLNERSVNFSFYDEATPNTLFNGSVNYSIISSSGVIQGNTSSGFAYVDSLTVGSNEIRYSSPGYTSKSLFFTVTQRSTENINLYLTNETDVSLVLIRLVDLSDKAVVGATLKLQKEELSLNGTFITIEECQTNDDGECFMEIIESTSINYRFAVVVDSVTIKTTTPDKILFLVDSIKIIKIQVDLGDNLVEPIQKLLGVRGDLDVNEATNVTTYDFIDSFNAITEGCLKVSRRILPGSEFTLINEQCVSGQTGIINYNYTSVFINNSEVLFEGIVRYNDGVDYVLVADTIINYNKGSNFVENDTLFFMIIIFSIIAFATLLIRNIFIQILIDFGLMLGVVYLGISLIGIPVIMLFLLLGLVIHWDRKSSRGDGIR